MTKVFISQPMRGKSEEYILNERAEIMETAKRVIGVDVEELPTYFTDHGERTPLERLAKSIEMLAKADIAIFAKGWDTARGCRIERQCCYWYGIEAVYYSDLCLSAQNKQEATHNDSTPA